MSAGQIARRFLVSRPAVSRHLRVLRRAGLVHENRVAQSRVYTLNPAPLARVDRWLESYRTYWSTLRHDLKSFDESDGTGI